MNENLKRLNLLMTSLLALTLLVAAGALGTVAVLATRFDPRKHFTARQFTLRRGRTEQEAPASDEAPV